MKKKILSLMLVLTMLVGMVPFSAFAAEGAVYGSGLDDGATYALKVPTDRDSFGQAYQWSSGGYNLSLRHENGESFVAFDTDAITHFQENYPGNWNTSIYAAGTTYGGDIAKKNEYAGGVPSTEDVSNTKYIAMRIKINDNNPEGSYTVSRFKPFIGLSSSYGLHATTTAVPAYWYDIQTGSYNVWYGNNGFWKSTEGAYSVVGDADGYIILPYALNSNVTAENIASSFKNIQFYFYENAVVSSGDNQRKASSWTNKEFLLGDCFFIEDIEKFVNARNTANGKVKYSSNVGDTAWIASKVDGATRNTVRGWASPAGKLFADPLTEPTSTSSYTYAHVAKITNSETGADELGLVFKMNAGKTAGGNTSLSLHATYPTGASKTDKFQPADGIPEEIDLENMNYLAQRVIFKGTEANPINGQGFRLYLNNSSQKHLAPRTDVILIDKKGTASVVEYDGGLDFYGDFDGWILVPMSGWGTSYWEDAYTTWSGGFQYFADGDWTEKTLILGNLYFVEDEKVFSNFHGIYPLKRADLAIGASYIKVIEPSSDCEYSIDGINWNKTGEFTGLEKDTRYTINVKNTKTLYTASFATATSTYATNFGDGAIYFMDIPDEVTSIRYGKGLGWSSNYFWRNKNDTAYVNREGIAYVHTVEINGETFVELTMNPELETEMPFCPSLIMDHDLLTYGLQTKGVPDGIDTENLTHMAIRAKITGLAEGKRAIMGILADPLYFLESNADVYLLDYTTKQLIEPEWSGDSIIFTADFDGWVVIPFDAWGKGEKTITYTDPETGESKTYNLTAKDILLGTKDPINGEANSVSGFQFWFHNDDESNDTGSGNQGCKNHWVLNSDWRGTTFYLGDALIFGDTYLFNSTRLNCDEYGHNLVETIESSPTCTTTGKKIITCKKCPYYQEEVLSATGHNYEKIFVEATATSVEHILYDCTECDDFYKEYPPRAEDGAIYFMNVPDKVTSIKYGQGLGWSSNYLWRNKDNTAYVSNEGSAYVHTVDFDGETFVELTQNPDLGTMPFCTSVIMDHDLLTYGEQIGGLPDGVDTENLTHLAFRIKITGLAEGKTARLGLIPEPLHFIDSTADVYLIDYNTKEIVDPNWSYASMSFSSNFDGWVVMPFTAWNDKAITYTDPETGESKTYTLTAKDILLGTTDPINGEKNSAGGLQFWLHNDDESNDTGSGNQGCKNHWVRNSDWRGTTLYMGDILAIGDTELFNTAHLGCEEYGHNFVETIETPATCTTAGKKIITCKKCDDYYEEVVIEATGHNYEKIVVEATETSIGYILYDCTGCDEFYTEYPSGANDGAIYYMNVPDRVTSIKYGKGLGWSSNYFWRNKDNTAYTNSQSSAYVHTVDINGETFIELTQNPDLGTMPFCPSLTMDNDLLTYGEQVHGLPEGVDSTGLTHLAFRLKLTGVTEGKRAILGVLPSPLYLQSNMSDAYLIDYNTKEVVDPGWTGGSGMIFTENFDGWVVIPISAWSSRAVEYKVVDENGDPVYGEDGKQLTSSYTVTAEEAFFGLVDPINGEANSVSSFQFWFHNDDESNDTGSGNQGCKNHWVRNSDWRGTTLYMGDILAVGDTELFNSVRLECETAGHKFVVEEKAATCEEDGYKKTTCSKCGHSETVVYEATGHSYSATVVPPTETEMGYTEHVCSNCGDSYKDNYTSPTKPGDDYLGLNIFHFTSYADNYTTDGVNTDADVLAEIEDVLAQGYVNQMFIGADDLMEEKIALCKKYNCKFWTGAGKFYSDRQTIENYIANVSVTVDRIIAADAWDLFLGFNWDEPIWGGMSNEDFYTMTKALYEKWGKRNYPVFATGAFIDGYGGTCDTIAPEYLTYVTDAGWDSYSYDVRDSALTNAKQNAQLAKNNEKYGTNITTAKDHYRWVQSELAEKFDHEVNFWFYPCAYRNYLWTGAHADEDYCMAHLEFFTELLMEQENKGGITLYTYATFGEGGTPSLDQYLPVPNITTGEQIMYPEVDKWEDYAQYVKELKVQFSQTPIYFADNLVFGSLYVTHTDSDSITIRPVEGYEYSIDGGVTYQTTAEFAGLDAETAYTIRVKRTEDGMYKDFVVMTRAEKPYASEYDDTASYAIDVPEILDVYGSAYGWVGSGLSRDFANTEFTAEGGGYLHVVTNEDGERFLEIQNNNADAMFTYNVAYGDNGRANSKKGISEGIDTSKLTAFAFRIKTEGGTDDQLSIFDFYINQKRTAKAGETPITLIDYNSGTVTTTTDAEIIKYENGINITGNIDGWIIVPFDSYPDFDDFSATPQISWLEENFNSVNVYLHEENCVSHYASASSWDDKNLYLGDMFYVEDVNTFVDVHAAPPAIEFSAVCIDRIKVNAVNGIEYSLDKLTWNTDGVFEGLTAETEYTVYARRIGGSRIVSATATTLAAHNYGAQSVKPTCTEQGYTVYTCRVCGDSYKANYRPAAGHTMEVTEQIEQTCTQDGLTVSTCSVCGYVERVELPALGHTAEFDRQEPTCTEEGYILYDCPFCGIYEEVLAPTGHVRGEAVEVAPSCTEQGYTGYICTTCGETVKETVLEATGHSNKTGVIAPTCTKQGYTKTICTVCGEITLSDYVDATGHSFITEVTEGKNIVYCEICDYVKGLIADKNSITVNWDAAEGAVKYFVKIQSGDWSKIFATTETSLTIYGLDAGTEYTVTISTKFGVGKYTEYENAMTVTTPSYTACTLQGTTVGNYTFLRFNCTGANKYWIKRVHQDGSVTQIKATDVNTLTLDYPEGEYTFYVIARVNINGVNKYITSNQATVTVD